MQNLTTFVEGTLEFFNQKTNYRYLSIKKTKKMANLSLLVNIGKKLFIRANIIIHCNCTSLTSI